MDLTSVDVAVLRDLYTNGDDVPANVAERTGHHRVSVSRCLSGKEDSLEERGFVESKGRGVWRLTQDGLEVARRLDEIQGFGGSE
jgi:DNA-binding IclR family transcriptional regulator